MTRKANTTTIKAQYTYKLRFHLGAGEHFMHWQLTNLTNGEVSYFNPANTQLKLSECKVVHRLATAKKINQGQEKSVCSWLEFNSYETLDDREIGAWQNGEPFSDSLSFNPRVSPNWQINGQDIDVKTLNPEALLIVGKKIYI